MRVQVVLILPGVVYHTCVQCTNALCVIFALVLGIVPNKTFSISLRFSLGLQKRSTGLKCRRFPVTRRVPVRNSHYEHITRTIAASMNSHRSNAKSPLETLPLEARHAVMRALPDVGSLKWLVLACSSFYHAFRDAESLITIRVLLNEVDLDVLPEAVAVFESARNGFWTRQRTIDFASHYLDRRMPPPQSWILAAGLSISKLYSHVHYFATDLHANA